jgi:hypothetical protein
LTCTQWKTGLSVAQPNIRLVDANSGETLLSYVTEDFYKTENIEFFTRKEGTNKYIFFSFENGLKALGPQSSFQTSFKLES